MDPVLMRYRVNLDLKRFDKAVKKLAQGGTEEHFELALPLIKKHRLFKQALTDFSHSPELVRRVKLAFGEYLEQRGYSEEAGFLYSAAGNVDLALHAFKKSLNVEMCLSLSVGLP